MSRLACLVFPWPRCVYGGSCKTCPFVMSPTVKIAGSLVRNDRFGAPTCLVSSRWFSCGVAVSMGEAGKPLLFECVQAGCHAVLCGRRGTLWHSNLFDNVSKRSKLEEVSHEILVFFAPTCVVSSLWFSCGVAVSMGEAGKHLLFECVQAGCHVVLRGRRGTLWHSNLFDDVSQMSKLVEVSHEMLVFLQPCVSSRVSGFSCGVVVSMGEAGKHLLFECVQAGCHAVLRGRRGTLWHSKPVW